jgi:hypothetical protein
MQRNIVQTGCCDNQLIITQNQGDNSVTIIAFPYDISATVFNGTVQFPAPISLSLGSGLSIASIISFTGSILNNTLTVTAVASGTLYVGMPVMGVGILEGTYISSFGTGVGGIGTYSINLAQVAPSATIIAGNLALQLTTSQTLTIPEGQYPFDLWTTNSGINTNVLNGFFVINPSLTVI